MLTIARYTLREAVRKRLLLAVVVLTAVFLLLYGVGTEFLAREIRRSSAQGAGPVLPMVAAGMTIMAFYIVSFLGGVLAIFVSIGAIAAELETGTILALAARPIHRWEIVIGKWLGLAALLVAYLVVVGVGALLLTLRSTGFVPPGPVEAIALIGLEALVVLSLAMLGSTLFSTLTNGGIAFMLFGIAWIGGLVEAFGTIVENRAMIDAGIVSSLLMPADALWKGASFHLQPVALILAQNASPAANPFTSPTPLATPMLLYSALYLLACLGLAIRQFGARDL